MNTIKKLIKSRTTYTIIAMAIINTAPDMQALMPSKYLPHVNILLTVATLYFKFNPSQNYDKQIVQD